MRTTKISQVDNGYGRPAFQFFGMVDGKAVHQSRKLWRQRSDCERAAKAWEKAGKGTQ